MFDKSKTIGLLMAFIATIFWASFYVVSRYVFGENENSIDPIFFSFLRFLLASVFFILLLSWKGQLKNMVKAVRMEPWLLAFLGLSGVLLEGVLVFWSLKYTTAARSSLFANASPIFTVILATIVLKERITWKKTIGMCIGFLGAAIAITSQGGDIYFSASSIIGDLLALGSGICWAAYTVWGANAAERHGSLLATAGSIIIGTAMIFVVVLLGGGVMNWNLSWKLWLAMAYLGVCGNGIAYLCWYAALNRISAGELGAFGYISAALAATLSFLFLKESFSIAFFLALASVVIGVYLMMEKSKSETVSVTRAG